MGGGEEMSDEDLYNNEVDDEEMAEILLFEDDLKHGLEDIKERRYKDVG
jgi:hypothetical protein